MENKNISIEESQMHKLLQITYDAENKDKTNYKPFDIYLWVKLCRKCRDTESFVLTSIDRRIMLRFGLFLFYASC